MEKIEEIFIEDKSKNDAFYDAYGKRFGYTREYPLHPPHTISRDQLEELGINYFYADKKDGINAFFLSNSEGMWLLFRNGKLIYHNAPSPECFADIEIMGDRVYILDAVKNTDIDMVKPFTARYMMRDLVSRIFRGVGIVAELQKFFSQKRLKSIIDEADEGVIAVPFSAPFPTAFHTTVLKYKFVETIDVVIVKSCEVITNIPYKCAGCVNDEECNDPVPVIMCRDNDTDNLVPLSIPLKGGPKWGLYEGIVENGCFVPMRFRNDKKSPNRWAIIKKIAERSNEEVVISLECYATLGTHRYVMSSDTSGVCSGCAEEMSFSDGHPVKVLFGSDCVRSLEKDCKSADVSAPFKGNKKNSLIDNSRKKKECVLLCPDTGNQECDSIACPVRDTIKEPDGEKVHNPVYRSNGKLKGRDKHAKFKRQGRNS